MLLSALLDGINLLSKYTDREVNAVSNDSRNIKNGDVFVCICGANFDGHLSAK